MSETALREALCLVGQSLFARGYAHSTAGNLSARLDDGWLITPTDACLGFLDPARLAKVDRTGAHVSGERPSKTLALHRAIYEADRAARCVIHTHSTHLVAASLAGGWREGELLPPLTPYFVMKVGHVPHIPYRRPGDPQAARLVAAAIEAYAGRGTPIRAVMLERLGPNAWHDSPAAAMALLEELEETARLWLLSGRTAAPLSEDALDELRRTFGARW